jgi:hypothetical protein
MKGSTRMKSIQELVKEMGALPTGSRALGYWKPDSDYDYFLQWEFGLESDLAKLGFCPRAACYSDPEVVGTMTHPDEKIDVIFVENIQARRDIMDALDRPGNKTWLAKMLPYERKDLWDVLVRAHRKGREKGKAA